jgi:hypothetical protein
MLFHLIPNDKLNRYTVACASDYVASELVAAAVYHRQWKLSRFLIQSAQQPDVAAIRGSLFEQWAHRMLPTGLSVNARCLSDGVRETWKLPRLQAVPVEGFVASVPISPSQYLLPRRANEAALDAAMCCPLDAGPEVVLLQMTVSLHHPVPRHAIEMAKEWAEARGYGCRRLAFVVPPDVYAAFATQPYLLKAPKGKVGGAVPGMEQYALEMSLGTWPASAAPALVLPPLAPVGPVSPSLCGPVSAAAAADPVALAAAVALPVAPGPPTPSAAAGVASSVLVARSAAAADLAASTQSVPKRTRASRG